MSVNFHVTMCSLWLKHLIIPMLKYPYFEIMQKKKYGEVEIYYFRFSFDALPLFKAICTENNVSEYQCLADDGFFYDLDGKRKRENKNALKMLENMDKNVKKYFLRMKKIAKKQEKFKKQLVKLDVSSKKDREFFASGKTLFFPSFKKCYYNEKGTNTVRPYRLHSPKPRVGKKYSVFIQLHGAGAQMGFDNRRQMWDFIFLYPRLHKHLKDTYVIVPHQNPVNPYNCDEHSEFLRNIILDIDKKKNNVDFSRIYIAGVSYGAHATVYEVLRSPDFYAAAMPCECWLYIEDDGMGDINKDEFHMPLSNKAFEKMKSTPFLVMHSENDRVCKIINSEILVNGLKEAGGKVEFARKKRLGHSRYPFFALFDKWDEWVFSQKRDISSIQHPASSI